MLTLVICTLGRTTELRRLLGSLTRQTDPGFRIVVVDQNPPGYLDAVLAEASHLPVEHVFSAPGLSRARNAGLRHVASTLVAFPDDDCWYPPDLVRQVHARFDCEPELDATTGRTVDANFRNSVSSCPAASTPLSRKNVFSGGNSSSLFVRADLASNVGGFNETLGVGANTPFGAGEETDFLLKCLRDGADVRFDHDLIVHHDQVARDSSRLSSYAAGFGRVCRLHGLGTTYMAPRLARAAARSLALAATGRADEAKERWLWIAGSMRGFMQHVSKKQSYPQGDCHVE